MPYNLGTHSFRCSGFYDIESAYARRPSCRHYIMHCGQHIMHVFQNSSFDEYDSCDKIWTMSDEVIDLITGFISKEILKDPGRQIREEEALISSGLIDSFGLVDLALYIEDTFGVRIEDVELTATVFDTPAELVHLISQRLPGSTQ